MTEIGLSSHELEITGDYGRQRRVWQMNAASMKTMTPPAVDAPLFPPCEPYATGQLDVGNGHLIYFEQCGLPTGLPVVFLHGGPGSGCSARQRQFFDPTVFRVVLFDQRGCGRSQPLGDLHHNTTAALVEDMEALRCHLGVDRWLVVGGSWGAALALAYAAKYMQACLGLLLRGVFLARRADVDWFFCGVRQLLPDAWADLARDAPRASHPDLLAWLHAQLHQQPVASALRCALAWEAWEQSVTLHRQVLPRAECPNVAEAQRLVAKYRLQSHYLTHGCFLGDHSLLQRCQHLTGLPVALLHGRDDWVCRPQAAWEVHANLPASQLKWVANSGHNPFEPGMAQAMLDTLKYFATHGHFTA